MLSALLFAYYAMSQIRHECMSEENSCRKGLSSMVAEPACARGVQAVKTSVMVDAKLVVLDLAIRAASATE